MSAVNQFKPSNGQPPSLAQTSPTQDASYQNLRIPLSKKKPIVISSTYPLQCEFEPISQSFLCYLAENEKFVRIDKNDISAPAYLKQSVVLSVSVTSALKLDNSQIELIARKMQRLTGFRNLKLENVVDPSLIAGFTIRYGDDDEHFIDLSVKGQLALLAARVESSEKRTATNAKSWSNNLL